METPKDMKSLRAMVGEIVHYVRDTRSDLLWGRVRFFEVSESDIMVVMNPPYSIRLDDVYLTRNEAAKHFNDLLDSQKLTMIDESQEPNNG